MVKLTERQEEMLRVARWQTDTNGFLSASGGEIVVCTTLMKRGLVSNRVGYGYVITPAGRAWLAEKGGG